MAKSYAQELDEFRRMEAASSRVQAERIRAKHSDNYSKSLEYQAKAKLAGEKIQAGYREIEARTGRLKAGMDLWDMMKPILVGGLIILFLVGPGLSAVIHILGSMNWWMWVIGIVVMMIIWRRS